MEKLVFVDDNEVSSPILYICQCLCPHCLVVLDRRRYGEHGGREKGISWAEMGDVF